MIVWLLAAWLAWCVSQLLLMIASSTIARPNMPCFTGFVIVIPEWTRRELTAHELAGIVAHERGHRRHLHVWANLLLVCLFIRPSPRRRQWQEQEADEFAVRQGYGSALESARATLLRAIAAGRHRCGAPTCTV